MEKKNKTICPCCENEITKDVERWTEYDEDGNHFEFVECPYCGCQVRKLID